MIRQQLMKTGKIIFLVMGLSLISACASNQKASEDLFLEKLLLSNIQETPYTLHVKVISTEKDRLIRADSGQVGYIKFRILARLIEAFKGNVPDTIEYFHIMEAPTKGPAIDEEFIVSLEFSPEKRQYYVPGNGYVLPANERLLNLARRKRLN